jgi:hypothetical protein
MSVPQTVAEVLSKHVVLEVESIDRMYLKVYVPQLQMARSPHSLEVENWMQMSQVLGR